MLGVLVVSCDEVAALMATAPGPARLRNELIGRSAPTVVSLDASRSGVTTEPVAVVAALVRAVPEAHLIVLGVDGEDGLACLRAGADGALPYAKVDGELLRAFERLDDGQAVLGPATTEALLGLARSPGTPDGPLNLTPTQERILDLMGTGAKNRDIAVRLGIAEQTVKNYATGIYAALGATNRAEAVARWTSWSVVGAPA